MTGFDLGAPVSGRVEEQDKVRDNVQDGALSRVGDPARSEVNTRVHTRVWEPVVGRVYVRVWLWVAEVWWWR